MQVQVVPVFKEGSILRQSMLQALSDHAYLANQLLFKDYGDGILSGCDLITTKKAIVLNPGIFLYHGQMYLIKEAMQINYYPTNTTVALKIHISEEEEKDQSIQSAITLSLTEETTLLEREIELCRFKLQDGAQLRFEYQDFEDRNTEFDTLNVIHAAYAAKGGSTLAPNILTDYVNELLEVKQLSDLDLSFCMQVMSLNRPIPKATIMMYLGRRNQITLKDDTNGTLYEELVKTLHMEKQGLRPAGGTAAKKKWRMMID